MFYRGEILSGVETLWAIVVIVPNERRASPELASGWSSERGYLTRSAAHDHAMTVIIRGTVIIRNTSIGIYARRSYSVRSDDARLVEAVDERTSVIVIFIIVHFGANIFHTFSVSKYHSLIELHLSEGTTTDCRDIPRKVFGMA